MYNTAKLVLAAGIAAAVFVGPALADRAVTIRNDTNAAIVQFQARPAGTSAWAGDVLHGVPLGVKRTLGVSLVNGGCNYDLYITLDDGRQLIQPGVNVCINGPVPIVVN